MTVVLDTNKGLRSIELERRTIRNGTVGQEVWMYGGVVVSPLWVDTPYTFTPPNPQKIVATVPPQQIVVEIPLPPRELQPNRALRADNRSLIGAKNQAKRDASLCLRSVLGVPARTLLWTSIRAKAVFFLQRDVDRDDDNLIGWLKSTRDQIAHDFGVTDNMDGWSWDRPEVAILPDRKQEYVILTLWGTQ